MAFWGVEIKPGKPFAHKFDVFKGRLHISMATLGFGAGAGKSRLQCNVGNKSPVYLCSLSSGMSESLQLNLEFDEVEDVIFSVIGTRSIHLCGYYLGRGQNTNINEESESYGEDIANTETERSDFSDEDDYDDSFIDDEGEPEGYLPSPTSGTSDKEEASNVKKSRGSRRRLRRLYQSVESDDDKSFEENKIVNNNTHDQAKKTDDEDSMPISSLYKSKATDRVLDQEMDVSDDRREGDSGNKNGVDGCNGINHSISKDDNVLVNSQTHSGADPLDNIVEHCTGLDVGSLQKVNKKKKEKGQSVKPNTVMEGELKMDNMVQDLPINNGQNQGPTYDNGGADPLNNIVEHCTGLDVGNVQKVKKKKKEKEGKFIEAEGACSEQSVKPNTEIEDELKMDNMVQDLPINNGKSEGPTYDSGGADPLNNVVEHCTGLDVGNVQKVKKKKKEKESKYIEAQGACSEQSVKPNTEMEGELKMDNMVQDLPINNGQSQCPTYDKEVELPGNVALPSSETDPEKGRGMKRKKKELAHKGSHFEGGNTDCEHVNQEYKASRDEAVPDTVIFKFPGEKDQDQKGNNEERGDNATHEFPDANQSEDRKNRKRRKKNISQGNIEVNSCDMPQSSVDQNNGTVKEEDKSKVVDAKPSQVRTLSNGVIIQVLEMGTQDGKIAAPGRKISVFYTGKLKDNGEAFDSNIGHSPLKFRLGKGKVIQGWDVGLEGMQVGEKRRLVIPPSMGFGSEGDGENVPPNSWLVYDFELVKVH